MSTTLRHLPFVVGAACALSAIAGSAITLFFTSNDANTKAKENTSSSSSDGEGSQSVVTEGDADDASIPAPTQFRRGSSLSGYFETVDGVDVNTSFADKRNGLPQQYPHYDNYDKNPGGTKLEVVPEEKWFADDEAVMQAREFDERVLSKITTLDESRLLLRRTRTVAALASRLMAAPDETSCYEAVSRLLVPLFKVDRCSYVLLKDADHVIIKQVAVNKREFAATMAAEGRVDGVVKPLKDTACGECAKTLKQHYTPRTLDSKFPAHRQIATIGINTVLVTPIVVNGCQFVGAIVICMQEEDAFKEHDKILVNDVANMLGANLYAKRLRQAAETSNAISREMLHSMIPEKVISKIECFWDERTVEYHKRKSSVSRRDSPYSCEDLSCHDLDHFDRRDDVNGKIKLLSAMNKMESDLENVGGIVDMSEMELGGTTITALYAEEVDNVCIVFTDIVGFSRIALELTPLQVMDMLQNLFNRFDALCDEHNVQKLETVGDAYICLTGLYDEETNEQDTVKADVLRALAMAKDMVRESRNVAIPTKGSPESLEIRVGVHIGPVTCGVLGTRLPKFTVFGSSVNLAARMEQTCIPSMVRVTDDVHDLVGDAETDWLEHSTISVKNMGEVGTWLLDPFY